MASQRERAREAAIKYFETNMDARDLAQAIIEFSKSERLLALEECAKIAETKCSQDCSDTATAIRALAEEK